MKKNYVERPMDAEYEVHNIDLTEKNAMVDGENKNEDVAAAATNEDDR